MVRWALVLLTFVGVLAGCLRSATYACESNLQCRHPERVGVCTDAGWCAYMEGECPSGWQYSPFAADGLADACVPSSPDFTTGESVGDHDGQPDVCDAPCTDPPGDCFIPTSGVCDAGTCVFDPQPAGEVCTDDCPEGGFCDASGTCVCAAGSTGAIDDCESTCVAGPHSTAAACDETDTCVQACEAPWQDCDADPTNGCEVPVGIAHQCDASGLNPDTGCWTAYCGASEAAGVTNFGTFHCVDCPTCAEPSAGQCHWCDHDTGTWFAMEACVCGAEHLDAVCAAPA